jgi:para-aminobenzoate synthetase/4-amino-4-deoxychorismate lyase
LAWAVEELPPAAPAAGAPGLDLAFHDHVVRCEHDGAWWFEALWTEERDRFLSERLELWRRRLAGPPPAARPFSARPLRPLGAGLAGHAAAVAETVRRIEAGELSQANICLRFQSSELLGDPLDLWVAGVQRARPSRAAYVSGRHTVLSLSPELFLARRGRRVITRPIKGTAPASDDPAALAASRKDRAENVMIVDLMRNDLGRVCRYGSVAVDDLCAVRPGPGVWHLESAVSGELRDGVSDGELLRATFPPGSVTGAPKIQALKTIAGLEATPREAYCGAIGAVSPLAGLELNVAIRTVEVSRGRLWLGAGGGIVGDSSASGEVAEAVLKARGALDAVGLALDVLGAAPVAPRAVVPPVVRLPRPDPGLGVFETMRVEEGAVCRLDRHLERLSASCRELGIALPAGVAELADAEAAAVGQGALRISVGPGGVVARTRPLPAAEAFRLVPVAVAGGLGAHKWVDRTLIDGSARPGEAPLLCDLDGTALEAGHAAVMAVHERRILAPPLDGRLLPSISRARTLRLAAAAGWRVELAPISVADLERAEAIVLCSSLRGPHPGWLSGADQRARGWRVCAELRALERAAATGRGARSAGRS